MKAKVFLIATIILFATSACEKSQDQDYVHLSIRISYIDKNGNDLLNPANQNGIKETDFDVYCLKDGEKTPVYFKNEYSETLLSGKTGI